MSEDSVIRYPQLLEYAAKREFGKMSISEEILPENLEKVMFEVLEPNGRAAREIADFYFRNRTEADKDLSLFSYGDENVSGILHDMTRFIIEARIEGGNETEIIGYATVSPERRLNKKQYGFQSGSKVEGKTCYLYKWPFVKKDLRGKGIGNFLRLAAMLTSKGQVDLFWINLRPENIPEGPDKKEDEKFYTKREEKILARVKPLGKKNAWVETVDVKVGSKIGRGKQRILFIKI